MQAKAIAATATTNSYSTTTRIKTLAMWFPHKTEDLTTNSYSTTTRIKTCICICHDKSFKYYEFIFHYNKD